MLTSVKRRLGHDDDQGFTLIELMVVVLIIAILLAIAIPTFLGAKNSANARAAQSNNRNALTAEQTVFTNGQAFSADVTVGGVLLTAESSLVWQTAAPTAASPTSAVSVTLGQNTNPSDTVFLETYGKDGNCYIIQQVNDPTFTGGPTTGFAIEKGGCTVPVVLTPTPVTTGTAVPAAKGAFPISGSFYTAW